MRKLSRLFSSIFRRSTAECDTATPLHAEVKRSNADASTASSPANVEKDQGATDLTLHAPMLPTKDGDSSQAPATFALQEDLHPENDFRLFALIVAIDNYKNDAIFNLSGCVNDGNDFRAFLTDTLHVLPHRILSLSNENATRDAIIGAFVGHFIQNPAIRNGDAMVFFYAGHGARVEAPADWLADGDKIETIVAHDEGPSDAEGEVIYGIPDRTFDGLMRQLAHEKGDNITAIFDSCHSGGMARAALDMVARAVPPHVSPSPVPSTLDQDIWRWGLSTRSAATVVPTGFLYKAMQSHVLMAACRPDEQALEAARVPEPRGAFTVQLLKLLRSHNLAELTYARLIELVQLRHQHPQCEGINKNRIIFDATKLVDRAHSFRVTTSATSLLVEAGSIHGIVEGTEFTAEPSSGVPLDFAQNAVFLATRVDALQSALTCESSVPFPETLRDFRVVVSKWNSSTMKTRLHYSAGSHCSVVGPNDYSDVTVHLGTANGWQLERRDPLVARHASRVLTIPRGDVSEILDAVARFNFNLYRHNLKAPLRNDLAVELHQLEVIPGTSLRPTLRPMGDDYFDSAPEPVLCAEGSSFDVGPVQEAIITDMEPYYGLTLVNKSNHDLFPYVFYFDPNEYSVQSWYLPPSPNMAPPLPKEGRLPIGYGSSGTDSLRFSLPSGAKVDSGFLKVFVSSAWVDMRSVQQASIFDKGPRSSQNRKDTSFTDLWDESISVLTCKASYG